MYHPSMDRKACRIVLADPERPRPAVVEVALGVLRDGGVVVTPTETLYGLAVDGRNAEALARVNRLKGKPEDSPVLLLLGAIEQVGQVAARVPPLFHPLAERFWPGPLTLVVPARPDLPAPARHDGTVALRLPGLALPRRLASRLGAPISGVSANLAGFPACRRAGDVARVFGDRVDLVLDGGVTPGGTPSTILDLTREPPRIVREGIVPRAALEPFLPEPR